MTNSTYLGVDLGGTNARYGLVAEDGRIIRQGRFAVRSERGPEPILEQLTGCLQAIQEGLFEDERPRGLAMGVAGQVLPDRGVLLFSPNLPGWTNIPLGDRLSRALGLPVRVENDANLYALGEWLAGAGRGLDNLLLVTLGTGVGGGLILNGRLWNGAYGTAAEVGHMQVEPEGLLCACGARGCLETIASATAIARTARQWIAQGRPFEFQGDPKSLTSARLCDLARAGDNLARQVFERAGWAIGHVLADVFNLLGLEGVVIGGGAAQAYEFIHPRMFEVFASRVLTVDPEIIRFAPTALGDDAPLVGAPALFLSSEDH